ncbi:uncharacterized protein FIESC28_02810 [Fusarium coffeatum]|uniref:Uncharacterized protein n=1 Tax=Fusarium coffeatum TaxID=231269 RepID=A0A366S6L3_9HYPO|nr:uncharacterized protein FIESC28_02810 [Fusarium coffeatum]RBR24320.1 hypothetical protein FIESC28_02810 [Fusarium coffeatum]
MTESTVLQKFNSLIENGLVFYDDHQQIIEHIDDGLKFQFLLTSALSKKPTFQTNVPHPERDVNAFAEKRDGSDIDTADYEICRIGDTHFLAANKFCYARPHLMLLTQDGHKRQYQALNREDWQALHSILSSQSNEYVAFYNCGQDGGCSRLHKHMQLIPKPKDSFAAFLDDKDGNEPDVPFQWFYHRFNFLDMSPEGLLSIYQDLLRKATEVGAGLSENAKKLPRGAAIPHNMLVTKQWMIVLPRRRAAVNKEAGANALGMVGVIAVATQREIDNWINIGPAKALGELSVPKPSSTT